MQALRHPLVLYKKPATLSSRRPPCVQVHDAVFFAWAILMACRGLKIGQVRGAFNESLGGALKAISGKPEPALLDRWAIACLKLACAPMMGDAISKTSSVSALSKELSSIWAGGPFFPERSRQSLAWLLHLEIPLLEWICCFGQCLVLAASRVSSPMTSTFIEELSSTSRRGRDTSCPPSVRAPDPLPVVQSNLQPHASICIVLQHHTTLIFGTV